MTSQFEFAPKFMAVVAEVVECAKLSLKCAVMVSKKTGYAALHALLKQAGQKHQFSVAEFTELSDFNDAQNLRGERYLVLLADSEQCAEGVEFKCVRKHLLVDVPPTHAAYVQWATRSVRCKGHSLLPVHEQEVCFRIYVAQLPQYA